MTGVLTLKQFGFCEEEVLDMPLDKFVMYLGAAHEVELTRRRGVVLDTNAAIGGAFSEKGVADYINKALSGD